MSDKHQFIRCSEPDIGSRFVYAYAAESVPDDRILSPEERLAFERHLETCDACQDDLIVLSGLIEQIHEAFLPVPLPVTSIQTPSHDELIHEYHDRPMQERLAASSDVFGSMLFPLAFSYVNGQVVGQFHKRPGGLLFFTLLHNALDPKKFSCDLHFVPLDNPDARRAFSLDTEEEQHVGNVAEIISSNTLSGMLKALKQFEVVVTRKR